MVHAFFRLVRRFFSRARPGATLNGVERGSRLRSSPNLMMENKTVSGSLIEVVLSGDAVTGALAVAKAVMKAALHVIIEKIPVIKDFVSVLGGVTGVREQLLLNKLVVLLSELGKVSEEDRWKFRAEMERNPAFREKVGEYLIILLDRLDSTEKARLVGKLFSAFLRRHLTFDEFQLACTGVDRAHMGDLLTIARNGETPHGDIGSRLFSAGLATLQVSSLSSMPQLGALGRSFQRYPLNDTGKIVLEVCYPHYEAERNKTRDPKRQAY